MSQESLQDFLQKISSDPQLRQRLADDVDGVVEGFGLSPVEVAALATGDEDALRRLVGAEAEGFGYTLYQGWSDAYVARIDWSRYLPSTNGNTHANVPSPLCYVGPC